MMKRAVLVVLFLVMGMGVKAQAPTNVNAGLENGHFVLKWDAVEGAVHYQVYHKEATMPFRLVADTEDTNISDNAYYWPCLDNYYYVVSCFADGSEYILDHGQYVFLDFFHYTCGPCREQAPFVVESYRYYGCNRHDVYYMEVSYIDNDGYEGINSLQSIIDALEPFEIEQHQCDYNVTDPVSIVDVYPNPADGFVNLSLEEYGVVWVYKLVEWNDSNR